jgi:hypothetical protein
MGVEIISMKRLKSHPSISSAGRMMIFAFLYRMIMTAIFEDRVISSFQKCIDVSEGPAASIFKLKDEPTLRYALPICKG